ncbi:mtDNA inheritance, partitioning of the mitochondrial organelle [Coemansia sp. RSA 521]|nr:mtDNA inheritance, partitioning of the mitochondrial organelle [Coemansia sp. RSA 521]KAJ2585821.1 mtDNA inheritance, partitioning of the mitochondrial organelle [Coemansia sp. RSA 1797]
MREVITLQFGENANYVGAHYWNLQEAYADEHRTGELFTQRSNKPSVPRALVFDAVGNFGAQALEEDLQSTGNDEIDEDQALWAGAKEVHRQPLYPKHTDSTQPTRMRFWSDFAQTKLSPHAMHVVSGVEFGNSLGEMNTFQEGLQVFAGTDSRGDVLEGNFRAFAEECDHLQGFQVLADAFGGFAGYGSAFMAKIRDEYPKAPILLYSVGRTQPARQLRNVQLMDAAISVATNSEIVSMSVPLFTPTPITKLNAHIHITDPVSVQLPRVFPQIFQGIDKQGFLANSPGPTPSAENAKQLRMAGLLCTSPASLDYLQQLHTAVKTEHSRHFKDYERETVREYRYTLDRMIDRYSAI